jgi:anti-anti-sigma regulatory factor
VSNLISVQSQLHVYLSEDPEKTGGLDAVRQLAWEMYDRDVIINCSSVEMLTEKGILILLTINHLLQEAGHKLMLRSLSRTAKAILKGFRVDHLFNYSQGMDPLF